jgi:hypothetical protein
MKTNLISKLKGLALAGTLALAAGCGGNHPDWNDPQVAKRVINESNSPIGIYREGVLINSSYRSFDLDGDGAADVISRGGTDLAYRPGWKSSVESGKVKYALNPETPEMSPETADKVNRYNQLAKEIAFDLFLTSQKASKQ